MIKEIITEDIRDIIKDTKKLVVKFYGEYCQPCKMMDPIIVQAHEELDYDIVKVCTDDFPNDVEDFEISNVPTFIVFEDGKEKGRFFGAMPKASFVNKVNEL